jgi:hypothetical protein
VDEETFNWSGCGWPEVGICWLSSVNFGDNIFRRFREIRGTEEAFSIFLLTQSREVTMEHFEVNCHEGHGVGTQFVVRSRDGEPAGCSFWQITPRFQGEPLKKCVGTANYQV